MTHNLVRQVAGSLLAGIGLLSLSGGANATLFTADTAIGAPSSACAASAAQSTPTTLTTSCSGASSRGGLPSTIEGSFVARADYSGLGASVDWDEVVTWPGPWSMTPSVVSARAAIQDTFVVSGGTGLGTLHIPIVVSGTVSNLSNAYGFSALASHFGGGFLTGGGTVFVVEGPGTYTLELPFEFGVQSFLDLSFGATIGNFGLNDVTNSWGGFADFSHSADFLPFEIFGSDQSRVSGATVISTSGFPYDVARVQVPEPGTLALLGVGLLGLAVMRRRREATR